jgi:hypothetical protein
LFSVESEGFIFVLCEHIMGLGDPSVRRSTPVICDSC